MVISAADGGPEEGKNEGESKGWSVDPGNWQEPIENGVEAAKDHAVEIGHDLGEAAQANATELGAAAAAGADQMLGTSFGQTDRLALGDEERLPWLESVDDDENDDSSADSGRLVGFVIFAFLLLAALVGGLYVISHRNSGPAKADGSLIAASTEPYEVAPKNPGGKTFQGTGDASFKVSEGEKPAATLAGSAAPVAKPAAPAAPAPAGPAASSAAHTAPAAAAAAPASGVGVQIGAFSTNAGAEAAWGKLASAHAPLSGLPHRVIEGKADMATVFRLQAVESDVASANALCGKLQTGGLKCQVKR